MVAIMAYLDTLVRVMKQPLHIVMLHHTGLGPISPVMQGSPASCMRARWGQVRAEAGLVGRYALNVFFNLQNKTIFNYFPYPWTVSAVHVVVGLLYCTVSYILGFRKASFGRVRAPCLSCVQSACLMSSITLFQPAWQL